MLFKFNSSEKKLGNKNFSTKKKVHQSDALLFDKDNEITKIQNQPFVSVKKKLNFLFKNKTKFRPFSTDKEINLKKIA